MKKSKAILVTGYLPMVKSSKNGKRDGEEKPESERVQPSFT